MILTKTHPKTSMKTNMTLKNLFPEFLVLMDSNVELNKEQKKLYFLALDPDPVWFALGTWSVKTRFGIVQNVIAVFIFNVFNVGLKTAFFNNKGTLTTMIWWTYQDQSQGLTKITKKTWNGVVQNVELLTRKQKFLRSTLVIVEKSRIPNLILGLFPILVEKPVRKILGLIVDINVWFFVIQDLVHHVQK